MDNNMLDIIKSFKETKKAIDEFVPLLTEYAEYSDEIKEVISKLKGADIKKSNDDLMISLKKMEKIQENIDSNINNLKQESMCRSKMIDDFEKKLESLLKQMEENNKKSISEMNTAIENSNDNLFKTYKEEIKKLENKLDKIVNSNNLEIIKIQKSIDSLEAKLEEAF